MSVIRMWVPIEFKAHVRKRQSERPDKSITEILQDIMEEDKRRRGRDGSFYSGL